MSESAIFFSPAGFYPFFIKRKNGRGLKEKHFTKAEAAGEVPAAETPAEA
jgi:hypothetical protein